MDQFISAIATRVASEGPIVVILYDPEAEVSGARNVESSVASDDALRVEGEGCVPRLKSVVAQPIGQGRTITVCLLCKADGLVRQRFELDYLCCEQMQQAIRRAIGGGQSVVRAA